MSEWRKYFEQGFRRAYREIENLEDKINNKEGFFIFEWHTYTIEELLQSEHHRKIDSITKKIGDDANNWYKRGAMPEEGKQIYEDKRFQLEESLHQVNRKIKQRQPTWIESALHLLDKFVERVMENLPPLVRDILLPAVVRWLGLPVLAPVLLPPQQVGIDIFKIDDNS